MHVHQIAMQQARRATMTDTPALSPAVEAAIERAKDVAFNHTWHPRECVCERGKTLFSCPAVQEALRAIATIAAEEARGAAHMETAKILLTGLEAVGDALQD